VTVVSGHDAGELDFAALAQAPGTLVFFMSLASLEAIADGLVRAGKPADAPAAVVANGTTAEQQTVVAPLAEIADAAGSLDAPALVVVGDVVALAGTLAAYAAVGVAAA